MTKPSKLYLENFQLSNIEKTYFWLSNSILLRSQIDNIEQPTLQGNKNYWLKNIANTKRQDYAIKIDDQHIGNCGFCNIDKIRMKAELWIYLGERYGKGFGGMALDHLLHKGFMALNLNKIYLRVAENNFKALKLYKGHGFVQDGLLRDESINGSGTFVNYFLMTQLINEYQKESKS